MLLIRASQDDDMAAIYAHHVCHSTATFELEAPSSAEMQARCEAGGIRKVMAIVGDSANAASLGLHRALGFDQVGVVQDCGWKFGTWLDMVILPKNLGPGSTQPPPESSTR